MRKYRVLTGILILVMLALAGCTKENEVVNYEVHEEASQNLSFFGNKFEAENVKVIEEILTGYMEENKNASITYESLKGSRYFEVLSSRNQSGSLDDIFMTDHDTALELEKQGNLTDLSDIVEKTSFSENMLSQMKASDGGIYWVPAIVSAFGMYCNLDLLKDNGQKIPENLEEWQNVCAYFVSKGITPIIANNDISLKTFILARSFYPLYQEGTQKEIFEKMNKGEEKLSTWISQGLELAQKFCNAGYVDVSKALKTEKTSDDLEEFVKGESPFMLTGAWAAGRVKGMGPEFEFQVVPYPILEEGSVLVINPDVRLSVSAKGENQKIAKDFVSYFLENDNIRKFADNQCSFIPLNEEYTPSQKEISDIVESYQSQAAVIASDSGIKFPIWEIMSGVSRKLLSKEDMQEIIEWIDRRK